MHVRKGFAERLKLRDKPQRVEAAARTDFNNAGVTAGYVFAGFDRFFVAVHRLARPLVKITPCRSQAHGAVVPLKKLESQIFFHFNDGKTYCGL
ncbi:hypothetical protein SDC9_211934 [bioreactor metagenome]|uniref:Uncharacterized protein n=1 Tax=bioreactor metagenome TaxID=1076179 RepID=A0A645JYJ5_9ZZZZ